MEVTVADSDRSVVINETGGEGVMLPPDRFPKQREEEAAVPGWDRSCSLSR